MFFPACSTNKNPTQGVTKVYLNFKNLITCVSIDLFGFLISYYAKDLVSSARMEPIFQAAVAASIRLAQLEEEHRVPSRISLKYSVVLVSRLDSKVRTFA